MSMNKNNYKELLKEYRGDSFNFLEDYTKSNEPILCKCNECSNEWKVAPYELIIRKTNCPVCSRKKSKDEFRLSINEIKERLINHYGYEPYTFLNDNYDNIFTKLDVKCNKCGYIFKISASNIFINIRENKDPTCKQCFKNNLSVPRKTTEDYQKELDDLFGIENSYNVLDDYIK